MREHPRVDAAHVAIAVLQQHRVNRQVLGRLKGHAAQQQGGVRRRRVAAGPQVYDVALHAAQVEKVEAGLADTQHVVVGQAQGAHLCVRVDNTPSAEVQDRRQMKTEVSK